MNLLRTILLLVLIGCSDKSTQNPPNLEEYKDETESSSFDTIKKSKEVFSSFNNDSIYSFNSLKSFFNPIKLPLTLNRDSVANFEIQRQQNNEMVNLNRTCSAFVNWQANKLFKEFPCGVTPHITQPVYEVDFSKNYTSLVYFLVNMIPYNAYCDGYILSTYDKKGNIISSLPIAFIDKYNELSCEIVDKENIVLKIIKENREYLSEDNYKLISSDTIYRHYKILETGKIVEKIN